MIYKKKWKKSINPKDIIICLVLLSNFAIPYIKEITFLHMANSLIKAVGAMYMCLVLLRNKVRLSNMAKIILLYGLMITMTTVLRGGPGYITSAVTIISAVALVEYSAHYAADFISDAMLCNEIIVYWNLLSMIIYPDGMFGGELKAYTFVLGIDNSHIRWLAQATAILFYKNTKKTMRTLALTGAITVSILMRFSATTIMAFICFWVVMLVPVLKQKMNVWISGFGYLVMFFSIIVIQRFNYLSWLIVDILHKNMTFTNRNRTWARTLLAIRDSWLFGRGNLSTEEYYHIIGDVYTHNLLLQFWFSGGIIALVIFVWMLAELNKNANASDRIARTVTNAFIMAFLVSGITEYHFYAPSIIMFMVLANNIKLSVVKPRNRIVYIKRKSYVK